ncbi:MAG: hypothetical protein J6J21_05935 [Clostridia bacterium]|nr:hypothetical protein [Clostridia bacterium]
MKKALIQNHSYYNTHKSKSQFFPSFFSRKERSKEKRYEKTKRQPHAQNAPKARARFAKNVFCTSSQSPLFSREKKEAKKAMRKNKTTTSRTKGSQTATAF